MLGSLDGVCCGWNRCVLGRQSRHARPSGLNPPSGRFVGLLLVTRVFPHADEDVLRQIYCSVGASFLKRLLIPLSKARCGWWFGQGRDPPPMPLACAGTTVFYSQGHLAAMHLCMPVQ